jgi:hypothetical protein
MENIENLFQKLSEKTGTSIEDLKIEYETTLAEVKASVQGQGKTEVQLALIARQKFGFAQLRASGQANLLSWDGIVLGVGRAVDTVAKQIKLSKEAYAKDAFKAAKGWVYIDRLILTDGEGTPLFPATPANEKMKRVGTPIPEHSWLRTVTAFGYPIDPKTKAPVGGPKEITMSINGNDALTVDIPKMQKVKFKALNKTKPEMTDKYICNYSAFTKFVISEIPGFPDIETVLRDFTGHFASLGELEIWHAENADNFNRWVVTEGSVTMINPEPNAKTGNAMMMITDESMLFSGKDKTAVTVWIPKELIPSIDFGVESRVFVVGSTSQGKAKDPVTNQVLEDVPGDVMINALGLYAPELFKQAPAVLPVTEQSVPAKKW